MVMASYPLSTNIMESDSAFDTILLIIYFLLVCLCCLGGDIEPKTLHNANLKTNLEMEWARTY